MHTEALVLPLLFLIISLYLVSFNSLNKLLLMFSFLGFLFLRLILSIMLLRFEPITKLSFLNWKTWKRWSFPPSGFSSLSLLMDFSSHFHQLATSMLEIFSSTLLATVNADFSAMFYYFYVFLSDWHIFSFHGFL